MAHYGMLRDYQFTADIDDVRGAKLYGADQKELSKVKDVIFDHDQGTIRYLVADIGKGRRVLVPADHVYRAVVNQDDFETDLTRSEAERLPAFNERTLAEEKKWREHEQEHRRAWRDHEEHLEKEFKAHWEESPVTHRKDSSHTITPDTDEMPPAAAGSDYQVLASNIFPRRLAGKFPGISGPMTVPGSMVNVTERPADRRAPRRAHLVVRRTQLALGRLPAEPE
jgi:hypothetical protein